MIETAHPAGSDSPRDCHAQAKLAAPAAAPLDLDAIRARLADARGPQYWRSLEELAGTPEFEDLLHREFPRLASEWPSGVSRRNFLQLAAASLGLAGLTACTRQPLERIVPYVRQPEEILPGRPLQYATAMPVGGYGFGLLAESHTGRPTKLEGNPDHPASLGATDVFAQAAILGLYDPDRSQATSRLGSITTFGHFLAELNGLLTAQHALAGAGLRILTETVTSPTLAGILGQVLEQFPQAKWHQWEPIGRDHARAAATAAFGAPLAARYDLARAEIIASFEADFLVQGPWAVRHAKDFAARRRVTAESGTMSRLYAFESSPTPTGSAADHRLATRPTEMPALLAALAAALGVPGVAAPALAAEARHTIDVLARDLAAHPGAALVVVGEPLPPAAHVLGHAINERLGAFGATLVLSDPIEAQPVDHLASLTELVNDLHGGGVDLLLVFGANPVYSAPPELDFRGAMQKAILRVHCGLAHDETSELCHWHLPGTHFLEAWGDLRAADGTASIVQPLIEPLYGGKSEIEILATLLGRSDATGYELVQEHWRGQLPSPTFDADFRKFLHDGVIPGTAAPPRAAAVAATAIAAASAAVAAAPAAGELEVALRPDPTVWDGRFANNGWLQELPKPITKLTWDNVLLLSPRTAEKLGGLASEQVAELELPGGRQVTGAVWLLPGQADGVVTVHLGYGRTKSGSVGTGQGFDAYPLQSAAARWGAAGATLRPTAERRPLATTQGHHALDWQKEETQEAAARHVVRGATLAEFRAAPDFARETESHVDDRTSLNPGFAYTGYAWGMSIDLAACTGCNACVVACQAENNIPVVGKEQVAIGREMQWLRIDRYFAGSLDAPTEIAHQPLPCMHCEQAPCEVVCPVGATNHSSEGLNDMVYNRCVGTRYCSNNCPYKVRRFNFLLYQDFDTPSLKLMRNPDVTVRSRGVMEKCTYCVQRINRARITAEKEDRKIRDGEIVTACQQACPSEAIVFGNINDQAAAVSHQKADPRTYGLLSELGTRPRTTYLARLRNPNPELAPGAAPATHAGEAEG